MNTAAPYTIVWTRPARKALMRVDAGVRARVTALVEAIAADPFAPHPQVKPLTGQAKTYRGRVGDFRVLYRVDTDGRLIVVVDFGNRREVYR